MADGGKKEFPVPVEGGPIKGAAIETREKITNKIHRHEYQTVMT